MSKTTAVKGGAFPCARCTKAFDSINAVRMHVARVHTKTLRVPGQKHKMTREEKLAKKRAYNRKWRLRKGMKVRPNALKDSPKVSGAPWTPERRAKFNKTWAEKKSSNHQDAAPMTLEDPRDYINHCPKCGEELAAYFLASGAMKRRRNG